MREGAALPLFATAGQRRAAAKADRLNAAVTAHRAAMARLRAKRGW